MDPASDILRVVRAVIGDGPRELQQPPILRPPLDVDAVVRNARWFNDNFEEMLRNVTKAKHAIALSSGSAGLYCALLAAGVGEGDEVLCPSLTFVASANAILMTGAIPHFVDVNSNTFGVHPFKLRQYLGSGRFEYMDDGWCSVESGRRIAAILPVHLLGIPCEINEIRLTADYYGITVIEDAAEALGSWTYTNDHCGLVGRAGVISFNLNKIITTGGGGAVITNDDEIAERIRHFATESKTPHPFLYEHDQAGFNFHMPPMCAALGMSQLALLPGILEEKVRLANRYAHAFRDVSCVEHRSGGNRWLNAALLRPSVNESYERDGTILAADGSYTEYRDAALTALLEAGYGARAIFTPLHTLPHLKRYPKQDSLAGSEDIFRRMICLPSSVDGGGRSS